MWWLWLAGVLVRLPALALPLLAPAAGMATTADFLAREQGLGFSGHPLLPTSLLAIPIAAGMTPTLALRVASALVGAALAPLTALLFQRLGASRRQALFAGLLCLVHPVLVLSAGGVVPSTEGWAACAYLGGCLLGFSERAGRRRGGALAALAAMLCHPAGSLFAVLPLWLWFRRESGRGWRRGLPFVALALFFFAPATLFGRLGAVAPVPPLWGAAWIAVLGVFLLVPLLPMGGLALVRLGGFAGTFARGALMLGAVYVLGVVLGPLAPAERTWAAVFEVGATLVPWVAMAAVLGGTQGVLAARGLRRGALGLGLLAGVALGMGTLHLLLAPRSTAPVARLTQRARALAIATQVVPSDGTIVLDLAELGPHEAESLRDLVGARDVLRVGETVWDAHAPRRVASFGPDTRVRGVHVAVVTMAHPPPEVIQTFGGAAIFQQEVVRAVGPYVVLRARPE